ncbi:MAG TPA: TauD/TfdA family dioxygenase, partial [Chitinophagales bacterium]|nr:TauD/TfdA family dioxygenase [Chitinophagales bacterium]
AVREEFDKKGVITVRNYSGLNGARRFKLWELKRWDEIFLTREKSKVETLCRENAIEFEWLDNGNLRLMHRTAATVKHPVTHETAWFNHAQVFHPAAAPAEYEKIHARQQRIKTLLWTAALKIMVRWKKFANHAIDQSMNVLFADGSEIPDSYIRHIEEVIWKNIVIFPWKKNDILAIDNFSTSHGRLPYEGKRRILVCWSA